MPRHPHLKTSSIVEPVRAACRVLEHARGIQLPEPHTVSVTAALTVGGSTVPEALSLSFDSVAHVAEWASAMEATMTTLDLQTRIHHRVSGRLLEHPVECTAIESTAPITTCETAGCSNAAALGVTCWECIELGQEQAAKRAGL